MYINIFAPCNFSFAQFFHIVNRQNSAHLKLYKKGKTSIGNVKTAFIAVLCIYYELPVTHAFKLGFYIMQNTHIKTFISC